MCYHQHHRSLFALFQNYIDIFRLQFSLTAHCTHTISKTGEERAKTHRKKVQHISVYVLDEIGARIVSGISGKCVSGIESKILYHRYPCSYKCMHIRDISAFCVLLSIVVCIPIHIYLSIFDGYYGNGLCKIFIFSATNR